MNKLETESRTAAIKSKAKASIFAEALFVFLPLIVMGIVFLIKGCFLDIFSEAEWSFAAAVLSGQTIVRLSGIVASRGPAEGNYLSLLLASIIVLILVPSLIVLVFVLITDPVPARLAAAQIVLFVVALAAFFFLGLVGDVIREGAYVSQQDE